MIARDTTPPVTQAQMDFLEILFGDLGFNRAQRNDWMSGALDREIKFLDELTLPEASELIQTLKGMKEKQHEREQVLEEEQGF